MEKNPARVLTGSDLFHSPANFVAFGFGSGLARTAPGTFGTLAALPLCVLCAHLPLSVYLLLLVGGFAGGVWICDQASRYLKVHDHGGIVWDEVLGMLITLFAIPLSLPALLCGFLLFRLFDIAKPWPIRWLDKSVDGGLGIMLDDVLAGIAACLCLHALVRFAPGWF